MKRIACLTPVLGALILGSAAMAVDLDAMNATPAYHGPRVASIMSPYSQEVAIEGSQVDLAEIEEPEPFLSGNIVGSWKDGYLGHDASLTQAWLTAQKGVDSLKPFDLGFRVDSIFGTEIGQCYGDEGFDGKWGVSGDGYGASIYQAYVEVGMGKTLRKGR